MDNLLEAQSWRREADIIAFLKTKTDIIRKLNKESNSRVQFGDKLYKLVIDYYEICVFTNPRSKELNHLVKASYLQYIKLANWSQIAYNIERDIVRKK